ncbi:uncharacterized protein [Procambarus clarkii]|nr:uncharacterized protein LOC123768182 [Procambarus clarkii]
MMRVLVTVCVVVVASVVAQELEQPQEQQALVVPEAIQALREPLTALPLSDLFTNMQNPTTVKFYVDCVTGEGTCDKFGKALQHLMSDQQRVQQLCYGCSKCEKEKLQYVMDTLKTNYKPLACQVQTFLKWNGLFGTPSPCAEAPLSA